jgi:very-short-patch-repair endonuclease
MDQQPWQTSRARSLRRAMTPAEARLWRALRGRRFDGLKFRRQFPIGPYFLDFYCHELGLAIEIDGETHLGKETHDDRRQKMIEATGITVLRFWNTQVYDEYDAVLEAIWQMCERVKAEALQGRPSPPAPLPEGEGSDRGS